MLDFVQSEIFHSETSFLFRIDFTSTQAQFDTSAEEICSASRRARVALLSAAL